MLRAKYITLTCKICGKEFKKILSIYKQDIKKCNAGKFCSLECFYKSPERKPNLNKKGSLSNGWKGGRLFERGYKLVIAPKNHPYAVIKGENNPYIREHRLIMEKYVGRYLKPNEIVHHKNKNTQDNRIENLLLMERGDHTRLHTTKCKGEEK